MVVTVIIASIIASLKVPAVIRVIMYADTFNTDIVFIGNNNDWRLKRIRFLISVMNWWTGIKIYTFFFFILMMYFVSINKLTPKIIS
jgi:hypothetical protein